MYIPKVVESGTTYVYNASNFRDGLTFVAGVGNRPLGTPITYYVEEEASNANNFNNIELTDATNLKNRYALDSADEVYEKYKGSMGNKRNNIGPYIHKAKIYGTTHQFMSYTQFNLTSYWIPVPKGMWYKFNGEDKRIENNGFFNLITGDTYYSDNISIFLMNDTEMVEPFNYFDDWFYSTTDVDYIIQANANINTYV
jgi:hypothetical protein